VNGSAFKGEKKSSSLQQKFLFAISEHEILGYLVEGYVLDITRFNQFSLSCRRVSSSTVEDHPVTLSATEKEILKITDEYSDESIVSRFSKSRLKPSQFYSTVPERMLREQIRPFIERRLNRCLQLLGSQGHPLYYKGKRKDPVSEKPLRICQKSAEVIFHFRLAEEGTDYHLTIRSEDGEIVLTKKGGKIISQQPCWLLLGDTVYPIDQQVDGNKLAPFFNKEYIHIPQSSEQKYFETFVLNAVRNFTVHPECFSIEEPSLALTAYLQPEFSLDGKPFLALYFGYDKQIIPAQETQHVFVWLTHEGRHYRFQKVIRDSVWEEEQKRRLTERGLTSLTAFYWYPSCWEGMEEARPLSSLITWLNENGEYLKEAGFQIRQEFLREKYYTGRVSLDISVQDERDWFDVHAVVHFGAYEIPFVRFKQHIINNNHEYILPNGEIALLPDEWFSRYREVMRLGVARGDQLQLRNCHAGLAGELDPGRKFPLLEDLNDSLSRGDIADIKVPEMLTIRLRPYQIDGFRWLKLLQQYRLGGCLADDMGLGKTLQILALLSDKTTETESLKLQGSVKSQSMQLDLFSNPDETIREFDASTSLVVMPLSLIWNWDNEIKKCAPNLRVYRYTGTNRTTRPEDFYQYDIVLTTYGVVRNDLEMLQRCEFRYIILDESQIIKNPFSKLFRAVRQLKSMYRVVLTGTPIENSLTDLWAQMTFLNDGILGNLAYFKEEFAIPIEKNKDAIKEEKLRKLIAPFILRRTKEKVASDLPLLTEKIYYCEMTDAQRVVYETRKSEIRNLLLTNIAEKGTEKSRFVILKGLMELRLLANHPMLLPGNTDIPSGKFEEVNRAIENIVSEGHKVLIFSSFVKHLKVFTGAFSKAGWAYSMLTGETAASERMAAVQKFQEDLNDRLFLITLKAGGVGLNLTAADYVFLLDPWWNPAVENQAISRAHRIGQEKKVIAYKFITKDTIEEKILNLQHNKSELASLFVNNNDPLRFFNQDTILQLTE